MPDFHQPDRADRAAAERELREDLTEADLAEMRRRAAELGVANAERLDREQLVEAMRAAAPSNRTDPAWPDAPRT
jgi:hypothetical protein